MSAGFSKAPWRYGPAVVTGKLGIIAADDTFVCGQLLNAAGYEEMAEANARLIAAAPELYEALKDARTFLALHDYASILEVDDALAKARGES